MRYTVIDRIKVLGLQPDNAFSWAAGDAVRNDWVAAHGKLPEKELRPKTHELGGSHCFAVYPAEFVSVMDETIKRVAEELDADEAAQQKADLRYDSEEAMFISCSRCESRVAVGGICSFCGLDATADYEPESEPGPINESPVPTGKDRKRLDGQREHVLKYMLDNDANGIWITLREASTSLGYPEASISARLRDFRKEKFGSYKVDRRRRVAEKGTWEYRVVIPFALDGA